MTKKTKSEIEAVRAALLGPIKRIEEMPKRKKKSVAAAMQRRIIEIITGPGVAKRIAENARRPKIFSRDDGVIFDPRWQDDGVTAGLAQKKATPSIRRGSETTARS